MTKSQILFLGVLLVGILGLTIYSSFFGPNSQLNSAIRDLKNAREEIQKTQQNLDSVLANSQTVLNRNADFRNYIHAVDSIVRISDAISRKRETAYLNSLEKLEKNISQLKKDLAKMSPKMPEPEYGELETIK